MFRKAIFESISLSDESHPDAITAEAAETQNALQGVDAEELVKIQKWAKILRITMILISTLMIITAWYNIASSSSSKVATSFIALYVFFFSIMICCQEIALRQAAVFIVQNFGFMYNPVGRMIFILFVSFLCFSLSTMGIVCFSLLITEMLVQIYVYFTHPQFVAYMKKLHYYDKVRPGAISRV
jgi:hypothetical protein